MIWIYWGLFVLGGGVLALQFFAGGGAHDVDSDGLSGDPGDVIALFFSLRLWAYFCLASGMVGVICGMSGMLTGLTLMVVSLGTGAVAGLGTTLAMRALRHHTRANPATTTFADAVGQVGRVLVRPAPSVLGKVRVPVAGQLVDVLATSDDTSLEIGDEVLVIAVEGASVRVCKNDPALPSAR